MNRWGWAAAAAVAALALGAIMPAMSGPSISGTTNTYSPQWSSTAASGSNAFQVINNGGRVDFGAGASDYASSNGTTVSFASPLALATANTLSFNAGATTTIQDSSGDMLVDVATGKALKIRENGSQLLLVGAGSNFTLGADVHMGAFDFWGKKVTPDASNTSLTINGRITDAASAVAVIVQNNSTLTSGTDRDIIQFWRDNGTNKVASIQTNGQGTFNGGVVFSSGGTAVTKHVTTTSVIDFASTSSTCVHSSAITLPGAVLGDRCGVGVSSDMSGINGDFTAKVTAADTVKVVFCSGAATQDPASATYTVECWH